MRRSLVDLSLLIVLGLSTRLSKSEHRLVREWFSGICHQRRGDEADLSKQELDEPLSGTPNIVVGLGHTDFASNEDCSRQRNSLGGIAGRKNNC